MRRLTIGAALLLGSSCVPTGCSGQACGALDSCGGTCACVATPALSPEAGTFNYNPSVAISTATPSATIHYTIDGSAPTPASPTYTAPISVASNLTVKAMATAAGLANSALATSAYTVSSSAAVVATPIIAPGTGSYVAAQTVTLSSSTTGAAIRYTLDGTMPTAASPAYTSAFTVSSTTTVTAIATASGFVNSQAATAVLTINTKAADLATYCSMINTTLINLSCDGVAVDVMAGRLDYVAAAGAGCTSALTAGGCLGLDAGEPDACRLALVPKVANGGTCYDDTSCANGRCNAKAGACPGVCIPWTQLNQACTDNSQCATGLTCDSTTMTCKATSAAGGSCPCNSANYCNGTSCVVRKLAGACTQPAECSIGYTCAGSPTATCQALVGLNGSCASNPLLCGQGYHCAASNLCVADPKVGDTCTAAQNCIGGSCDAITLKCVASTSGGSCSAAPGVSGLSLYDGFGGAAIDGTRWQNGGYTRGVDSALGKAVFGVDVANQRSRSLRNDSYSIAATVVAGGSRVTSIQANVMVPAATASLSGGSLVRTGVRVLYNPPSQRLSFPGANLNLFIAEVGLIQDATGLKAYRMFGHCDDPACASFVTTGISFTDPAGFAAIGAGWQAGTAATFDTSYTASLSLDEATGIFHWSISGGAFTPPGFSGTANPAAYIAATPIWAGAPFNGVGFNVAQLATRAHDLGAGGGGAALVGQFDNVLIGLNGATASLFDDFSGTGGNSGPSELSPAKWSLPGTTTLRPVGGSLLVSSQITSISATNTSLGSPFHLSDPTGISVLQADVAIDSGPVSGSEFVGLGGRFYNDGSSTRENDATGDIYTHLVVYAGSGSSGFYVGRCVNATCSTFSTVGSGILVPTGLGAGGHRLQLRWSEATRTFTYTVDGVTLTVDPTHLLVGTISAPALYGGPARAPTRSVVSNVSTSASGIVTGGTVRVSDLFTGP
jgi:hypothetical protein